MSSNKQQLSPWGHALSGAMGAVFANAVVYPLDTVKTRIQASSSPSSSSSPSPPSSSTNPETDEDSESESTILARVNRKLGLAPPSSSSSKEGNAIPALLLKITREEGLLGFYKGFLANMLNTFSMQYAYFFFYSLVRSLYVKRATRRAAAAGGAGAAVVQLGTAAELLLGAVAGALAQVFTLPVAVVATRQQLENKPRGMLDVAKEIIEEDGVAGLWNGIKPGLVLTVNPAITYGAFERLKGIALQSSGKEKLSPAMAFLVGATSKSLATVVTYPYIMAKVRLQAKHVHSDSTPTSSTSTTGTSSFAPLPSESAASTGSTGLSYADAAKHAVEASSIEGEKQAATSTSTEKPKPKASRPKSAIEVLTRVYQEKGFTGWYQGMSAQIFKAVLSQGILFMLKDQFESYAFLLLLLFSKSTKSIAHSAQSAASHIPHPDVQLPSSLPPLPSSLKEAQAALPSLPAMPSVGDKLPSLPAMPSVSATVPSASHLVQSVQHGASAFAEKVGTKVAVDLVVDAIEGK